MHKSILKNLWQVGGDRLTASSDAAIYLIRCGEQAALVDAGCGGAHEDLVANINGCLQDTGNMTHLLLTHCHFDHTGGADAIRQTFGCKIVAHANDALYLEAGDSEVTAASWYGSRLPPLVVDIKLQEKKTRIEIGNRTITAHHTPGHSPGSLVYVTTLEDKVVLFGQDVHGPIHPALLSDPSLYQDSLKRLLALDADLLLEGHFGIIEGKGAVRQFIKSFMDR
jgi:glyoxylase-like metal-dependent hydrolase (beta-lactamase superfamily II)